jgi:HSP20 family protein
MLMRFDPFRELDDLAERLQSGRWTRSMPLDAYRVGDFFHVDFDLPGVTAESIEITVEKNILTVKAERHWVTETVETIVHERPVGTFTRQLFLGETLDTDNISATYHNGVLRLRIPVAEEARSKKVEVKSFERTEPVAAKTAA